MCLLLFLLFGITIAEKTYIDHGTSPGTTISSTISELKNSTTEKILANDDPNYINDTNVNYTNDTNVKGVKDISVVTASEIEDFNKNSDDNNSNDDDSSDISDNIDNNKTSEDLDLSLIFKTIIFPNNATSITGIQNFVQKILSLVHQEISYKCTFIEMDHCKIIDNIIYAFISTAAICIFFSLIYIIHSLYKLLSVYNNYKEAKRVFLDLETKI